MDKALTQLLILLNIKKDDTIYDWMGFKVTEENYITGHHIVSKCDGGEDSVDNIALLSLLSHRYLHQQIEEYDQDIFNELNSMFKILCLEKRMPNEKEQQHILYLMYLFEKRHKRVLKKKISYSNINPSVEKLFNNIVNISSPHGYRIVLQNGIDPIKRQKVKVKKKKRKSDSY